VPETELKLFKRCVEYQPRDEIKNIPRDTRGIYALLRWRPRLGQYEVVYVGMARQGVRARLTVHARKKRDLWTHFSVFEVFDNVRGEEIAELEGSCATSIEAILERTDSTPSEPLPNSGECDPGASQAGRSSSEN
jgi:hypothetical protein